MKNRLFGWKMKPKCALMGCKNVLDQNLGEIIKDETNEEVINQAKSLIEYGYEETDYFCKECFWK